MESAGRRASDRAGDRLVRSPWIIMAAGLVATAIAYALAPRIHPDVQYTGEIVALTGIIVSVLCAVATKALVPSSAARDDSRRRLHHDELTGLPNRTGLDVLLYEAVSDARRTGRSLGVLFCDLDRFAMINESVGRESGDRLLEEAASRLTSATRSSDSVSRIAGDEFVVLSGGLDDPGTLTQIARQILQEFDEPVTLDSGDVLLTPSIGIAHTGPAAPTPPDQLLQEARAAMERARENRIGFAVFDDQQRSQARTLADTGERLRGAIEDSDLHVFYQPIIDVEGHRLRAIEALVRWNRSGRGWVAPEDFLDAAAEAGLMASLGELVLKETIAQTQIWTSLYWPDLDVSTTVNVSERQLMDSTFADQIQRLLDAAGLDPRRLTLEISEEVVMGQLDRSLDLFRQLSAAGVGLAIDDFGTGQTALRWIERLDMVDVLKIDRAFVQGVDTSSVNTAIVEAMVSMARAAELVVVAEGVETRAQYEALRQLGVTRMQGYLFEPPMRAQDFEARMEQELLHVP
ncbi:MAG: bifunctional diguanylate cyclase/phosphodiesterase [Acidimicrobiia bacterium]|nr:bifunctional diguanylate cyclase/phosphodiesterase [Acidimicrobiia bacterium]